MRTLRSRFKPGIVSCFDSTVTCGEALALPGTCGASEARASAAVSVLPHPAKNNAARMNSHLKQVDIGSFHDEDGDGESMSSETSYATTLIARCARSTGSATKLTLEPVAQLCSSINVKTLCLTRAS